MCEELIEATLSGDAVAVEKLVDQDDVDIDYTDIRGNTALMHAARLNNTSIARILLSHGADASLENKQQQTATSLFSKHGVNLDELLDFKIKQPSPRAP